MESILTSIKQQLGIEEEYSPFDPELIIFINSSIASLSQLGVGPEQGFSISDETSTWGDYVGEDPRLVSIIKTCIFLKVKILFDPPMSSIVMESLKEMMREQEWRLRHHMEVVTVLDKKSDEEVSGNGI